MMLSLIAGVVGLVMGSFYNVLIYRLPRKISIVKPERSFCPSCDHQLAWKDNVPVFSYIFLGGKCRYCGERISPRYPIVESVTAVLFVLSVFLSDSPIGLISLWLLFSGAVIVSGIDFEHMLIPDSAVVITAIGGVMWSWGHGHIVLSLITAAGAFGFFALIYLLSKGGMGFGDVEYFAVLGLFMTPLMAVTSVLFASLSALVIVLPLMLMHKAGRKTRVPFGPFLAIGTVLAMFLNFRI